MKKVFFWVMLSTVCLSGNAWADREIEIEFRFQPDRSGKETRNQGIKVEDDDAEIYLDGTEQEINMSDSDSEALFDLVEKEVRDFQFVEGKKVRPPYIEVKMEFSGEDREIEISRSYPAGSVPQKFIDIQEKYLKEVWR
ncbi:MAG: hypothetical protein MI864_20360 [Pseudomonadales bacterium]|nr:hypothetical protein [Pseudomonadales bacterium]